VIKTLFLGIWVCVIALGSSYFSSQMHSGNANGATDKGKNAPVEFIKSDMISVPVIRSGKLQGYVVAQFTFAVDSSEITKLSFEPTPFLIDSAFRTLYDNLTIDFSKLQQQDLTELAAKVVESANKKIGAPIAKDVLLNDINYVARDEVRTNWVKK
jgi:hypothetical protein